VRLIEVEAALSRRLLTNLAAPIALAFSGGGDSLALLLAAHAWAGRHGRSLIVLTVDHQLQPASEGWSAACAERAAGLGLACERLAWTGPKPDRGLPAAARDARHRLLAEAARRAGARVILMGHTADDVHEAGAMRAEGGSTPEPREWGPSPIWPEGRGLFLLRPILGQRRAEIRAWLTTRGETWIDDPANEDLRFARPRARKALATGADKLAPAEIADASALALACQPDAAGGLAIPRSALQAAQDPQARRFLAAACLSAGGGARPPRRDSLERLAALAMGQGRFAATLAGARVEGEATMVRIFREAGEAARGGLEPLVLQPGTTSVWDGRFEIRAREPGLSVQALRGSARQLDPGQRRALARLPAGARGALPLVLRGDTVVGCPAITALEAVELRPLVYDRLSAACGAVLREPAA
jgi:tRNA(Ile)-lysidine synthase